MIALSAERSTRNEGVPSLRLNSVIRLHPSILSLDLRRDPTRIEGFKPNGTHRDSMSQATKIVLGTIGVSAILGFTILFSIAFA